MALGAEYGSLGIGVYTDDTSWMSGESSNLKNGRPTYDDLVAENSSSVRQIGGNHYSKHKVSPWDIYADWFGEAEMRGYLLGCIVKYIVRYRDKGGILDLEKARHMLDKLIEVEGKQ